MGYSLTERVWAGDDADLLTSLDYMDLCVASLLSGTEDDEDDDESRG